MFDLHRSISVVLVARFMLDLQTIATENDASSSEEHTARRPIETSQAGTVTALLSTYPRLDDCLPCASVIDVSMTRGIGRELEDHAI